MPIQVALYTKEIGGRQFAFDSGDISFGDAETKEVQRNVGTDIVRFTLRKRQVTFTIRGATSNDIQGLYGERADNINRLVAATGIVPGEDIDIGGETIFNALLLDVQAGPPITVAGVPVIEQVQVRYDSQVYV